ncbi:hypothetical protein [Patiriisocius sp. Uisw_017]|uniref:hypothetical protein n=1 Tax=Patiriisocius sp. Uisw_017 TaxID=3230968 RepID=UPI0039ED261C
MRIILEARQEPSLGFNYFLDLFYEYAFFHIGAMIGCVIALLFIIADVFYFNKKLKNVKDSTLIRFIIIVILTIILGILHYVLEKVADVI